MRRLIVSIHSTANDIVTRPPSGDESDLEWASAGVDESLDGFHTWLHNVETILLGRATDEDLVRRWPRVKEWADMSDLILRVAEKVNTTPKIVVTRNPLLGSLEWDEFEPPTRLSGPSVEEAITELKARGGRRHHDVW